MASYFRSYERTLRKELSQKYWATAVCFFFFYQRTGNENGYIFHSVHIRHTSHGCDAEFFFTRGQFWPSSIVIACVCVSVRVSACLCVCINHLLVRTITHQPFTLESPNLDARRKTPWLRCLLFWGVIDFDLQGQI